MMSNYYIGTPNEGAALYHYGVKGMKWGVRKDPDKPSLSRAQRKEIKKDYKSANRSLKQVQNRQYKSFADASKDARRKTSEAIKADKKRVNSGEISKQQHKQNVKAYRSARNSYTNSQEYNMALAQYYVQKQKRANKVKYLAATKGKNSKAYQRGLKAFNNNTEYWGNYTITRNSNGGFSVTRTDYYYV